MEDLKISWSQIDYETGIRHGGRYRLPLVNGQHEVEVRRHLIECRRTIFYTSYMELAFQRRVLVECPERKDGGEMYRWDEVVLLSHLGMYTREIFETEELIRASFLLLGDPSAAIRAGKVHIPH